MVIISRIENLFALIYQLSARVKINKTHGGIACNIYELNKNFYDFKRKINC